MQPDTLAQIMAFVTKATVVVITPFLAMVQRNGDYYWPFLVVTLVVALGFHVLVAGRGWAEFFRLYFSKALWAHPSAKVDYRYYLVNGMLYPVVFAPMVLSSLLVAGWVAQPLAPVLSGTLGTWGVGPQAIYTVLFFVFYDLGRFLSHSALHDVPVLWEFHKVHHSAEVLTPFTACRVHPVDLLVMAFFPNLLTGVLLGVFQATWGGAVGFYTVLGLHAIRLVFDALGNLKHWQVPVSYGRLEQWLLSPVMHQVHHSALRQHWGMNRGFELALWDRLYGTWYRPAPGEATPYGLGDGSDGQWHRVGRLLLWPFSLAAGHVTGKRKQES